MTPRDSTPDPSSSDDALLERLYANKERLRELGLRLERLRDEAILLGERADLLNKFGYDVGHGDSSGSAEFQTVDPHHGRRPRIRRRHLGGSDQRGSTLIFALVLCAILAAVIWACLSLSPDVRPILEQVDESVGQFIGGAW